MKTINTTECKIPTLSRKPSKLSSVLPRSQTHRSKTIKTILSNLLSHFSTHPCLIYGFYSHRFDSFWNYFLESWRLLFMFLMHQDSQYSTMNRGERLHIQTQFYRSELRAPNLGLCTCRQFSKVLQQVSLWLLKFVLEQQARYEHQMHSNST